jgi:hypothetical protein
MRAWFGALSPAFDTHVPSGDRSGDRAAAWTGRFAVGSAHRPPGERPCALPDGVAQRIGRLGGALDALTAALGGTVGVEPFRRIAERGRGLTPPGPGDVSVGGGTRLLRTLDGWLAVSLARPEDEASVEAWLEARPSGDLWRFLERRVAEVPTALCVERAVLLSLPVAALGECAGPGAAVGAYASTGSVAPARRTLRGVRVVNLSALWAGPLAARILADAGAECVEVESVRRIDHGRDRAPGLFDSLHRGNERVQLDFSSEGGRRALAALVEGADVVIEGSRPRALRQLGIDAERVVRAHRPAVWLSITGHGRYGEGAHRVGFGDDAAVAGGLVHWRAGRPAFLGDAIADPLTGMTAAAAVCAALLLGGRWVLDVPLCRVASVIALPHAEPRRHPGQRAVGEGTLPQSRARSTARSTALSGAR